MQIQTLKSLTTANLSLMRQRQLESTAEAELSKLQTEGTEMEASWNKPGTLASDSWCTSGALDLSLQLRAWDHSNAQSQLIYVTTNLCALRAFASPPVLRWYAAYALAALCNAGTKVVALRR
jgi:hypothetical protein